MDSIKKSGATLTSACSPSGYVITASFSSVKDHFNYDVDKDPLWLQGYEFTFELTLTASANIALSDLKYYTDVQFKTSYGDASAFNETFYSSATFNKIELADTVSAYL